MKAVFEHTDAHLALLDEDFRFLMVNSAYAEGSGFTPEQLIGRSHFDLFPNADNQAAFERVRVTGVAFRAIEKPFEYAEQPQREVTYWNWVFVPVRNESDKVEAYLLSLSDVTHQVRGRQQIEALAEAARGKAAELQAVLDSMVDSVFACDCQGRITLTNRAALSQLGAESTEEVADYLHSLPDNLQGTAMDGSPLAPKDHLLLRALSGQTIKLEDQMFRDARTGRVAYLRSNATPIRGSKGEVVGALVVSRDVTELTELERLKAQFISVAAHELKTPVTIMKSYAQALLRCTQGLSPQQHRMLEAIDVGANRMNRVIRDLLDISKLETGHLDLEIERVDLVQLVEQVVDEMSLAASRHRINLIAEGPVAIQADRSRLAQVLVSLIDNAIRYSPRGGDVTIEVVRRGAEEVVSVADHGVGIPASKQARIGQRFYRAHTHTAYDFGGMGVGLHISKEIVARHGGRFWFESQEGEGSVFYFSLPIEDVHGG